jgi:iron donor protein CyaY
MTEPEFRSFVAQALNELFDAIDELDPDALDPTLTSGVLKVVFEADRSVFVLSQQVPTQELWLSANLSAYHFRYVDGQWIERDTAEPMLPLLSAMFTAKLGEPVQF